MYNTVGMHTSKRLYSLFACFAAAAFLFVAACASPSAPAPGMIADLDELPQRASAYLDPRTADIPLFADAAAQSQRFLRQWYGPWSRKEPRYGLEEVNWGTRVYGPKLLYGENLLPRPSGWIAAQDELAGLGEFPNLKRPGIALANTSFRVLPTDKPAFRDPKLAGEGFPFDYMQNSALWAGTPLYLSHLSRDRAWVLCETQTTFGWVPARDVAPVDEEFMVRWRSLPLAAVTADRVPLADGLGRHFFEARIGMALPLAAEEPGRYVVLAPRQDLGGMARISQAAIGQDQAAPLPLPATPKVLAGLMDGLMGRFYGWGGLYGERDCSATLQDLFIPVGVLLPRDSFQQIQAGAMVDLTGLGSVEKREAIAARGRPFATLLGKRGHVALYLGQHDGQTVIFHSIWGLGLGAGGQDGRHVIGRAVVTTLTPGQEVPGLSPPLLETLSTMTLLTP
ncbi:MAG: SH3 domain-containing protein [Desulfocurvibacter africanus]